MDLTIDSLTEAFAKFGKLKEEKITQVIVVHPRTRGQLKEMCEPLEKNLTRNVTEKVMGISRFTGIEIYELDIMPQGEAIPFTSKSEAMRFIRRADTYKGVKTFDEIMTLHTGLENILEY